MQPPEHAHRCDSTQLRKQFRRQGVIKFEELDLRVGLQNPSIQQDGHLCTLQCFNTRTGARAGCNAMASPGDNAFISMSTCPSQTQRDQYCSEKRNNWGHRKYAPESTQLVQTTTRHPAQSKHAGLHPDPVTANQYKGGNWRGHAERQKEITASQLRWCCHRAQAPSKTCL
jgi:hypothetical protein